MLKDVAASARAVAAASDDAIPDRVFKALTELKNLIGGNGCHLLIDGQIHHTHPLMTPLAEAAPEIFSGHHPSVSQSCILTMFWQDPRWEALARRSSPTCLRVDDALIFPQLRERMVSGAIEAMLFVPLWYAQEFAGYFVFFSKTDPFELHAEDIDLLYAMCDLVGQALLIRHARRAAQHVLAAYESVLEHTDGTLFSVDDELRLTYVSPSWAALTGVDPSGALGMPLESFVAEGDQISVRAALTTPSDVTSLSGKRVTLAATGTECVLSMHASKTGDGVDAIVGVIRSLHEGMCAPSVTPAHFGSLTAREKEIVSRIRTGQRVRGIARDLNLSEHTVRNHLKRVFKKFGVSSQGELIELLVRRSDPL